MRLLGRDIVKSSVLDDIKKELTANQLYTQRPALDKPTYQDATGGVVESYPFSPIRLYGMARHVDAIRIVLEALRREIFRNGIKAVEKFAYKCSVCQKEFASKPENEEGIEECDNCHATGEALRRPDYTEGKQLRLLIGQPVNVNQQTLLDVLFQIEWDLDVMDNGHMLLIKTYEIDPLSGEISSRAIKEIIRGDPLQLFYIADATGKLGYESGNPDTIAISDTKQSKPVLVCPRPEHRDKKLASQRCERCGAVGVMAIAVTKSLYSSFRGQMSDYYYIDGEIIYGSKYQPSLLYGYSPIYAIWQKAMTLFYQDKYMLDYYDRQRAPVSILAVATKSITAFQKAWDLLKQWRKEDPHQVHPLVVETDRGGKNVVQYIDMMKSLTEMQFIEARNEFRRTIGAEYGVLPLFSGDLPTGWNNEGMQMMVTNRAVQFSQDVLLKRYLDKLVQRIGVKDWKFEFESSESADKLRDLQIEAQMLANAESYVRLGMKVWFSHTGELMHSKVPVEGIQQQGAQQQAGGQTQLGDISGKRPNAPAEQMTNFEGEPKMNRPSDLGGVGEGHPASGDATSLSYKTDIGCVDELIKSLEDIGDNSTVEKSINSMKQEAQKQAWQYNYVEVGRPMQKDVRNAVQVMFAQNVPRSVAKNNLVQIGLPAQQADLIIKTEFNAMLNRARELAYKDSDPEGTMKYYWDTSSDDHVCEVCKAVEQRSSGGVTLQELKAIVKSIATEMKTGTAKRMWSVHPADRCVIKRMK